MQTEIQTETGQEPDSIRLFSDAAFNVSGRIAISLIGLFILPLMLHRLGAAVYGVWLAALAVVSLCATIDLGMGWAVAREAAASGPEDPATRTFLRSVLLGFAFSGLVGAAIITAVGFLSRHSLRTIDVGPRAVQLVFFLAALGFIGEWLFAYVQSLLYGIRRFDVWNTLLIGVTLTRATGIVILLAVLKLGLLPVAAWHASCSLAAAFIGIWLAGNRANLFSSGGVWFSFSSLRSRLSFGVFSQLSAIAASGLWQAGPIILGYGASTIAVTSLTVGQRLPTGLSGIGSSLAEAVFPAAAEHQANDNTEETRRLLLYGSRWTLLPVLPACLVLIAIGPEIIRLWIGDTDPAACIVLRLVSLAIICDSFSAASLHLLWGRGRSGLLLTVFGAATGLAILAMLFIGSTYGAPGIAACILASTLIYAPAILWLASRETALPMRRIVAVAAKGNLPASLLASITAYGAIKVVGSSPALSMAIALLLSILAWMTYMFIFGMDSADMQALRRLRLRKILGRIYPLRAAYYFLAEVIECMRGSHPKELQYYEMLYRNADPYSYSKKAREIARHQKNAELMAKYVNEKRNLKVCELGCSEGMFTELIEPLCGRLTAFDLSPTALQRAKNRRQWRSTTTFASYDLLGDQPWPERFDVIIAMHSVEFARRSFNRKALRRLVEGIVPGGYLLLDSQRHHNELEDAGFRRFFYRGKWLNRMFAKHPALKIVEEYVDDLDVITVFCRR